MSYANIRSREGISIFDSNLINTKFGSQNNLQLEVWRMSSKIVLIFIQHYYIQHFVDVTQ